VSPVRVADERRGVAGGLRRVFALGKIARTERRRAGAIPASKAASSRSSRLALHKGASRLGEFQYNVRARRSPDVFAQFIEGQARL